MQRILLVITSKDYVRSANVQRYGHKSGRVIAWKVIMTIEAAGLKRKQVLMRNSLPGLISVVTIATEIQLWNGGIIAGYHLGAKRNRFGFCVLLSQVHGQRTLLHPFG